MKWKVGDIFGHKEVGFEFEVISNFGGTDDYVLIQSPVTKIYTPLRSGILFSEYYLIKRNCIKYPQVKHKFNV